MSIFYRHFLLEDPRALPRAHLAAFGKHPGWNDHIDDIGLETGSLILAKQTIYLEGLSSQIDVGAWEKLEPGSALGDFDHVFLWQRGVNMLVGAIVASRDGKGRARYPMIVCAQFNGASPARVWSDLWPLALRALEECRATTSAQEVVQILLKAREELRRSTGDATPHSSASSTHVRANESLAGQPALGPDDEGLVRILYQIKNRLVLWAPGKVPAKLDESTIRGAHMRLPQVYPDSSVGLRTWAAFIASQLDPSAPRLFIWPRAGSWLDLIAGRPSGSDFFCLRANHRALPCISDVPFTMEDSFRDLAQVVIDDLFNRVVAPKSIFDRSVAKAVVAARKHRHGVTTRRGKGRWWFAMLVLMLAVGSVVYGLWCWKTLQSPLPLESQPPPPATVMPAAPVDVAPATSPDRNATIARSTVAPESAVASQEIVKEPTPASSMLTGAWATLCVSYDAWVGSFQKALEDPGRRRRWAGNPYLSANVIGPLDDARGLLSDLNPYVLANVSGSDFRTLQRSPPSTLQDEQTKRKVLAAAEVVNRVRSAFREWTILAETRDRTERVKALGWTQIADGIAFPDELRFNDRLARTIDQVLVSWANVSTIVERGDQVISGLQLFEQSGDPALASFAKSTRERLLAITVPANLESELRKTQAAITPVISVLSGDWRDGLILRSRFMGERGPEWEGGPRDHTMLAQWMNDVAAYTIVPDEEMPLPAEEWRPLFAQVEQPLQRLEAAANTEGTVDYRERLARLKARWDELRGSKLPRKELPAAQSAAKQLVAEMSALAAEIAGEPGR